MTSDEMYLTSQVTFLSNINLVMFVRGNRGSCIGSHQKPNLNINVQKYLHLDDFTAHKANKLLTQKPMWCIYVSIELNHKLGSFQLIL